MILKSEDSMEFGLIEVKNFIAQYYFIYIFLVNFEKKSLLSIVIKR